MLRTRVANLTGRIRDEYRGHRIKSIGREVYFRASSRFTPTLEAEWGGKRFLVRTYDRAVGLHTFVVGPQEQVTLKAAVEMLKKNPSQRDVEGLTFLEIGGNIGTTSVVALQDYGFGRLECFEPLPDNYELLTENLRMNGLSDRSSVHQVALAESEGEVEFEISPENSGDGRIKFGESEGGAFGEDKRDVVTVRTNTFDSFVESGSVDLAGVGLAWIDAQGSEGTILKGGGSLLKSDVPVVIEFWPYGLKRAGGEAAFLEAIRSNFTTIIDLGDLDNPVTYRPDDVEKIFSIYGQPTLADPDAVHSNTDLLLINE